MDKVDYAKDMKDLYSATEEVTEVEVGKGTFLHVDGQGEPGGEAYKEALGVLYPVVYSVKFALRNAGLGEYRLSKLESLWYDDPKEIPKAEWRWRAMIRVPEEVNAQMLKEAKGALLKRKNLDASTVALSRLEEGRCLQILHVGPFDTLELSYRRLASEAEKLGLSVSGPAHDIYLSYPGRVAPQKKRTIIRMPVR